VPASPSGRDSLNRDCSFFSFDTDRTENEISNSSFIVPSHNHGSDRVENTIPLLHLAGRRIIYRVRQHNLLIRRVSKTNVVIGIVVIIFPPYSITLEIYVYTVLRIISKKWRPPLAIN
jgi:hypothetical protein